ncbi:MAG: putative cytosol aminopeptidase [Candidatus Binatia bacterium]|nr:MAG: putative cytosol aminopeptidase [Candidatus Binatia bacterium]
MKVRLSNEPAERVVADLLLLVVRSREEEAVRRLDRLAEGRVGRLLDVAGASETTRPLLSPTDGRKLRCRMLGVLLLPPDTPADWRLVADSALSVARDLRARRLAVHLPAADAVPPVAETLLLGSYAFDVFRSEPPSYRAPEQVLLLGKDLAGERKNLERAELFARATCFARDLVNLPAAVATPAYLARVARKLAREGGLRCRVYDRSRLRRLGMGGILGVGQGSAHSPCLVELVYLPRRPRLRVALVGKGITFDSGGLVLKNAQSIQTQKRDMAGGASVLGVFSALPKLGLPVEVRGYVPLAENMPDARAIKPGDVVRIHGGTTVEVLNTDAEGRLVLADALSFAQRTRPHVVVDCATLTAAVRVALGNRYAAVLGNDRGLVELLREAGESVGEKLWELPLVDEYRKDLESSVADLKNVGENRAGTIVAGLFLERFVRKGLPWAHIDFSSTAFTESPFPGHPAGASGFGVRTLLRFLELAPEKLGRG